MFRPLHCTLAALIFASAAGCSDDPVESDPLPDVEEDLRRTNVDTGQVEDTGADDGLASDTDADSDTDDLRPAPDTLGEVGDCGVSEGGLIISEIVDPNIDLPSRARYVELYNAGNVSVDLTGWRLVRHFDADGRQEVNLPSQTLAPCQVFVIGRDEAGFSEVYSRSADWVPGDGATGSVIDNNGDDAVALFNSGGVVDQFGIPDEASGDPSWSYDDSVVSRNPSIVSPSPTYQTGQWTVTPIPEGTTGTASPGTR